MFITQCPKLLRIYQEFKERPTICNERLRTICCPIAIAQEAITTTATTQSPLRSISEKSKFVKM